MPLRLAALLSVGLLASADDRVPSWDLFPASARCPCTLAGAGCGGRLSIEETALGDNLFQLFLHPSTRRELFRAHFASRSPLQSWRYSRTHLCLFADLNGDGLPDYTWFGADDANRDMLLFLSTPSGSYRTIDILHTVQQAAARQSKDRFVPDLHTDYVLYDLKILARPSSLFLSCRLSGGPTPRKAFSLYLIPEKDFLPPPPSFQELRLPSLRLPH